MSDSKKHNKIAISTTVASCIATLVLGFIVGLNWENISNNFKPYLGFKTSSSDTIDLKPVQNLYGQLVDSYDGNIDKNLLVEGAKKGMVAAVGDKYTEYMTKSEAADYRSSLEGTIEEAGIGVSFAQREDYVRVLRTLPDNPARKAGVLAGDIIYAVDDVEVWQENPDSIAQRLRGANGTKVKLTVVRNNKKIDFLLTREKINNVSADILYENDIAILSVYRFSSETGALVEKLAKEAVNKKVKGMIVDLRSNGGGYVNAAKAMMGLWIDGETILKQQSRTIGDSTMIAPRGNAILKNMKTIVLTNAGTASAAEMVVGALKDYKKATIVGEKTYGKGVMQSMLDVSGGGMLKVTTAHWYTPLGGEINEKGIVPDIEVERTYEQINKDQDPQLSKAKSLIK